jgi:hypothetical protein
MASVEQKICRYYELRRLTLFPLAARRKHVREHRSSSKPTMKSDYAFRDCGVMKHRYLARRQGLII